jgi:hypothetical protein
MVVQMVNSKGKKLIFKPEIRSAKDEVVKHYAEIGKRFVFLDKNNFPEGNVYMIERVVRGIRKPYEPAKLRSHTVNAIMVFTGFGRKLEGMEVGISLGTKKYRMETPFVVFVPKNTKHSYKIIRGSGTYQKILFAPGGDYNKVTK